MKISIPCGKEKDCCGCMACYNSCQFESIEVIKTKEGFHLPTINSSKCKKCGACYRACPIHKEFHHNTSYLAYAGYAKSSQIRYESSSGGIFTVIANKILEMDGIVFGASFNGKFGVEHIACETVEDLNKLRGAKYLQSYIGKIFSNIRKELNKGRMVYFTGTPCQVAGLRSYLNKEYDNLICSDLICHGVPSPKVWQKFLSEQIDHASNISFRDKRFGWTHYSLVMKNEAQEIVLDRKNNTYMEGFLQNYFLRNSCYDCQFKGYERLGDITLADFWGIQNIDKTFDSDDKGSSLLLINTQKGEKIFDAIKSDIVFKEVDRKIALSYNKSAFESAYKPIQRKRFFNSIDSQPYSLCLKKVENLNVKEKILIRLQK